MNSLGHEYHGFLGSPFEFQAENDEGAIQMAKDPARLAATWQGIRRTLLLLSRGM